MRAVRDAGELSVYWAMYMCCGWAAPFSMTTENQAASVDSLPPFVGNSLYASTSRWEFAVHM